MDEPETSLSVPELGQREIPAFRPQATCEPDVDPSEGIDCGKQDAIAKEEAGEYPVSEVVHHGPAPIEPDLTVLGVQERDLEQVELHLREDLPRDFRREKESEVHQDYVGFIEIHVTGAGLSKATTLAIPDELTKLGLGTDLRSRLSERMRIDLSGNVDLGARDVNRRVDAFREIFTKQMRPP